MPVPPPTFPVRGACPGVGTPMEAADGMLLRLRRPGGAITPDSLRIVADVAERFGSGVVELTARANLQIRGVDPSAADDAGSLLVDVGLALPDPTRDERRDVVGPPLAGNDPTELVDLTAAIDTVADRLSSEPGLDGLPPKFGVVLDGGGATSVRSIGADIALGAVRADDGRTVLQVELGRALDEGDPTMTTVAVDHLLPVVLAAARQCASTGERMSASIARAGRDSLVDAVIASADLSRSMSDRRGLSARQVGRVAAALRDRAVARPPTPTAMADGADPAGLPVRASAPSAIARAHGRAAAGVNAASSPAALPGRRRKAVEAADRPNAAVASGDATPRVPTPIGPSPHRYPDRVNLGAAPFLGRTSAGSLSTVATVAKTAGASIRLTPWRGLVLVGVPQAQVDHVVTELTAAGFSSDPADPAHLVSACVGSPGCASSRADTQAAGRALLDGPRPPSRIHLSGCEKGCGAGTDRVVVADDEGRFEIEPW